MDDFKDWYSEDAATFGDRMAGARDAVGLSQSELARRLGVKIKTVRSWENDLTEPRANKLQLLSGILGVSLIWLLNGEGEGIDAPSEENSQPDMSAALMELRQIRTEIDQSADRLARLEKRMRQMMGPQT